MTARNLVKEERQRLLAALIAEHDLTSQEEVRRALAEQGIETAQATISRDLGELGAVKVRGPEGVPVYRLSSDPGPAAARDRLGDVVRRFVVSVEASGNLAVLRTPPAGAGPVASAIDLSELPGVVATVAGDDTVLVVAEDGVDGHELAARFRELTGL